MPVISDPPLEVTVASKNIYVIEKLSTRISSTHALPYICDSRQTKKKSRSVTAKNNPCLQIRMLRGSAISYDWYKSAEGQGLLAHLTDPATGYRHDNTEHHIRLLL